jgi:hypothetical protein
LTVFFTSERSGNQDILSSTSNGVTWSPPQPELASAAAEANGSIASDGLTLYWGLSGLQRINRAAVGQPWSASDLFYDGDLNVNVPRAPDISVDDLTLYFEAVNGSGVSNIFTLTRPTPTSEFSNPLPVPGLPTTTSLSFPAVSADQLELYFEVSVSGSSDIYVARRTNRAESFGPAQKVVEVNSASEEADVEISTDGTTLWFASSRPGGAGSYDIYFAVRACQ